MNDRTNIDTTGAERHVFYRIWEYPEVQVRIDWHVAAPAIVRGEIQTEITLVETDVPEGRMSGIPTFRVTGNDDDGVEVSTSTGSYAVRNGGMTLVNILTAVAHQIAEEIDSGEISGSLDGKVTGIPSHIRIPDFRSGDYWTLDNISELSLQTWEQNMKAAKA